MVEVALWQEGTSVDRTLGTVQVRGMALLFNYT